MDENPIVRFIKMHSDVMTPTNATEGSAGYDIYAYENTFIAPFEMILLQTGLKIQFPKNTYGRLVERSSIAKNHQIIVLGGVIDSSYRGQICIMLYNLGKEKYEIKKHHRYVQLICESIICPPFTECRTLDETARGENGFGHSGQS